MATRQQIARIEQRIEALAAGSETSRIIVVGPGETNEQALRREGIPDRMLHQHIFVHTGVPRADGLRAKTAGSHARQRDGTDREGCGFA
jgi:hypothetical protein